MLKFQMVLIAILIACFAFVSCERAQQIMIPVTDADTDANGADANGADANGADANGADANGADANGADAMVPMPW